MNQQPQDTEQQALEMRARRGFKNMLSEQGMKHAQEFLISIGTGAPMPEDLSLTRERFLQIGREELLAYFGKLTA